MTERATTAAGRREPGNGRGTRRASVDTRTPLLDGVVDRLAERVGGLIRFWGFGPHAGRVWALLYLSPRPLPAGEIGERLGLSAGSVSQTLSMLERWGVVRRFRAPGRKLLLCAGTADVWGSVMRVLGERETSLVHETSLLLERLLADVGRARAAGEDAARAAHVEARLRALLRLSRAAETMIAALLAAGTLNLAPLRRLMRLLPQGKE